jgi:hypothetical protein
MLASFNDSNRYDTSCSYRAWYGGVDIRSRGHDRSKTSRVTHQSWRDIPLGDARRMFVCGYIGRPRLAPHLVVSPYCCWLLCFRVVGLSSRQTSWERMASSARHRARRFLYCHGDSAISGQLGNTNGNPRRCFAVGMGASDSDWVADNRLDQARDRPGKATQALILLTRAHSQNLLFSIFSFPAPFTCVL